MADVGANPGGSVGSAGEGIGGPLVAETKNLLDRPAVPIVTMNFVVERDEDRDQFAAREQQQRIAIGAVGPDP